MHPEIVIFDITHRCTSQCAGCAFREAEPGELAAHRWVDLAREAKAQGFRQVVVTGGEPLAHPEIATILAGIAQSLPIALMTNGLALRKHAPLVRAHVAEVYVSWDAATEQTYEQIRGVRGLSAVREGVAAVSGRTIHARTTIWEHNVAELDAIRVAAEAAGCTEMSVLAADTSSDGFGARGLERGRGPRRDQLPALAAFLGREDPFVRMSAEAKARVLTLAAGSPTPPRCAAPWTSGVVDSVGNWRHCFFLASSRDVDDGLRAAMAGARAERRQIDVRTNPVCAKCVCWRA